MQVGKISGFVTICPKMEQSGLFEVVPLLKMDSCIHNDCLSEKGSKRKGVSPKHFIIPHSG
jgi:hypothetical protein